LARLCDELRYRCRDLRRVPPRRRAPGIPDREAPGAAQPPGHVGTGYFNVGNQNTDGVDYKLDYRLDTETAGEFKFYVAGTETLSFERQVTPSTPVEDLLGRLSGASEIARPESVLDLGTDWQLNDWSASLSGHYISSLGDGDFKFDNETVDSWLTFSASLGYELNEHHSFLVSVRNLTDEEPPYASSPTNGYASSVHDWLGRRWNVRYTFKF